MQFIVALFWCVTSSVFSLSINLNTDLLTNKGLGRGQNDNGNGANHNSNAHAHGSVKAKGGLGLDSLLNIGGLLSGNAGGHDNPSQNHNQPAQSHHQVRSSVTVSGKSAASNTIDPHPQQYGSYMTHQAKPIVPQSSQNGRIKGDNAFPAPHNSDHKPKVSNVGPSNSQHAPTNTKSNGKLLGILPLDNALNLKGVIKAEGNLLNSLIPKSNSQGQNGQGQGLNPKSLLNIDGILHGAVNYNNKASNDGHASNGLLGGLTNSLNLRHNINIG